MTLSPIQTLTEVVESKVAQDKQSVNFSLSAWCSDSWRKIVAEFISTSLLLLFGCMSCIPFDEGYPSAVYSSLGFGMVVMFNIQIFGHVSGAHMNPAVTLSYMIFKCSDYLLGIAYIIAQCLGAMAGYGVLSALVQTDMAGGAVCVTQSLPEQTYLQSIGIEAALTSALMLVNCALWDPVHKDLKEATAIKFGLTILGLSIVGGPLTGASMNPARSLGPAVWTNVWTAHWIYWVGPIVGSIVSTVLYKALFLMKPKD